MRATNLKRPGTQGSWAFVFILIKSDLSAFLWYNFLVFTMKIFKETNIKRLIIAGLLVVLVVSFSWVRAATVDELKQQQTDLQKKLADINAQIKNYQGQISTTQKQQASLKNDVFIYDTQIKTTELQIQAKETEISETNLQINELQLQIDRRIKEIEDNKKILAELISELYQLDSNALVILTLGDGDFSEFLDQLEYTTNVQDKMYDILQNIKTVKAKLEAQQSDLRIQLKKLEEKKDELESSQTALEQQRKQKQQLLDQTRGLESNYKKLLASSEKAQDSLEKEISDLDAKVRKELGNKTIAPSSGVFAKPMDGVLTQKYGNTGFTSLGYTFHNGIDWAAPAGTPIYAAADGVVNKCDTGNAAYGNWCTIKHNISTKTGDRCIITLYAHMRSIKAKAGQKISQGDKVGEEGNTGNTTRLLYGPHRGFHLHFTVFDCEGFGVAAGAQVKTYGHYTVPYGYTYNPLDFF